MFSHFLAFTPHHTPRFTLSFTTCPGLSCYLVRELLSDVACGEVKLVGKAQGCNHKSLSWANNNTSLFSPDGRGSLQYYIVLTDTPVDVLFIHHYWILA